MFAMIKRYLDNRAFKKNIYKYARTKAGRRMFDCFCFYAGSAGLAIDIYAYRRFLSIYADIDDPQKVLDFWDAFSRDVDYGHWGKKSILNFGGQKREVNMFKSDILKCDSDDDPLNGCKFDFAAYAIYYNDGMERLIDDCGLKMSTFEFFNN